ncbi:MAG: LysM peptidoglycan-binding domain-containing protein [Bacteroidota bacterium]|nr:LysM peptidoglycan-binding domain-containing protein [Bacteroidota bacterium]
MKIEVKENLAVSNVKYCEYPFDSEYSGLEEDPSNLKIYIEQETLENIEEYLSSDQNNELGGVLVGEVCINSDSNTFILIENLITAKHTNSSLSRLTFTHETWNYINQILERQFSGKKILGWFHSHPGHTVFLSTYDVFIQENFFNLYYMVAYVFDPTIKERGFFFWKDKQIVKAERFYIYKKPLNELYNPLIKTNNDSDQIDQYTGEDKSEAEKPRIKPDKKNIIILSLVLLTLLLLILMFYNLYDLKQNSLLKDEYRRDLSELKEETKKLNGRLDNFIMENVLSSKEFNGDSISNNIQSGKKLTKYTVRSGDTIDKIADEFYKNKQATQLIIQKNNLKNKWDIRIGQVLELPVLSE